MNRISASLISGLVLVTFYQSATPPTPKQQGRALQENLSPLTTPAPQGAQKTALTPPRQVTGGPLLDSGLPQNEDGPWSAICRYFVAEEVPPLQTKDHQPGKNSSPANRAADENRHKNPLRPNCEDDPEAREWGITVKGCNAKSDLAGRKRIVGDVGSCVRGSGHHATFLIATVPDPINSNLAMEYDRALESIERAAAVAHYNFASYWIPWDEAYRQPQTDVEKLRSADRLRHVREQEPGVLIFYGSEKPNELLFVFLVGETPSSGINKPAFVKASNYIGALRNAFAEQRTTAAKEKKAKEKKAQKKNKSTSQAIESTTPKGCDREIRDLDLLIAGPSFSASLNSLSVLFNVRTQGWPACIRILSGSVTNRSAIEEFVKKYDALTGKSSGIRFDEIAFNDDILIRQMLCTLHTVSRLSTREIAFLTETASAYRGATSKQPKQAVRIPEWPTACGDYPTDSDLGEVTSIKFPRGIAPLRNAYEAMQESLSPTDRKREYLPTLSLPLSLKQSEFREQEKVSVFAKDQTPISQDAVMQQISRTFKQRPIKAVVIYATDALDTLFLVRYLRQAHPNLRIVLPTADLVFVRSADPVDYSGTLTFTQNPLFTGEIVFSQGNSAQNGSDDQMLIEGRDRFPSSLAEAEFLAVVSLLQPGLRFRAPQREVTSPAISSPTPTAISPTIWMGVLGKTGYWPVREIAVSHKERSNPDNLWPLYSVRNGRKLWLASYMPEGPTRMWLVVLGLMALLSTVHCALVLIASQNNASPASSWRTNLRDLGDYWWLEYFAKDDSPPRLGDSSSAALDEKHRTRNARRIFYLLIATLIVVLMQVVVLVPTLRFWDIVRNLDRWVIAILAMSTLLGTVVVFWIFHQQIRRGNRPYAVSSVLILLSCAVLAGLWLRLTMDGLPFAQRAIFLTSGVSPVLPLLLIGAVLFFWSMTSMRRLTYCGNREPGMPTSYVFDNVLQSNFYSSNSAIDAILQGAALPGLLAVLTTFAIIIALLYTVPPLSFRSIEGPAYDAIVVASLWLVWWVIFVGWFRFIFIWVQLRGLLRRLERLPIRYAFSRIPSTFSWSPIWQRGGMKRSFLLQTRSLEYLRCLQGASDQHTREVETALNSVLQNETRGKRVTADQTQKLREAFSKAADFYASTLLEVWQQGGAHARQAGYLKRREYLPRGADLSADDRNGLAAEFVALRFLGKIRYVSLQMRNLLTSISFGFIVTLLALKSYPFQPQQTITWSLIALFVVLGIGIILVFAEMDRDAILSRISDTKPGKLDPEFFWRVAAFGALPLLTILASQIPAISNFLFSWVRPGLESLR